MNIIYTASALSAYRAASPDVRATVDQLRGTYAAYRNRHGIPGRSTLRNISRRARDLLGLASGPVFEARV